MSLYLGNKKVCPIVYSGTKVGKTITVINKSSSAVKKGDIVFINESPDYSYDFYKVGDVVVDDNTKIASGFSTRNAIKISKFIDFSNSWEMNFKITTGSDVTTRQKLNGCLDNADFLFPTIELSRSGYSQRFMLCISSTGSSWDITSDAVGTYQIQPNKTYWVRFGWTGSTYYLDYSLNGKDYTRDITVNSSLPVYNSNKYMGIGNDLYTGYSQVPFLGEIDLLETYIKSNNNVWWRPVTALPKEYHIVDYRESTSSSILGVATEDITVGTKEVNVENGGIVNDGIMSTYVADKTRTEQITVYKNKKFEGVFKVKASEWSNNDNHFIKSMEDFFYVRGGGDSLWSVLYTTVSNYYQKPFSSLDWIYIKIEHNEHWLAWSCSLDGENYELMYNQPGSNTFVDGLSTFAFNLYFGCKGGDTYPTWNGQIDFNECYFKVDDRLVWSGIKYVNGGTGLVEVNE